MSNGSADRPRRRPWWVRLTLWRLATRRGAMANLWFCLLLALVGAVGGLRDARLWCLLSFLLGVLGYGMAIRWVDRHDSWK